MYYHCSCVAAKYVGLFERLKYVRPTCVCTYYINFYKLGYLYIYQHIVYIFVSFIGTIRNQSEKLPLTHTLSYTHKHTHTHTSTPHTHTHTLVYRLKKCAGQKQMALNFQRLSECIYKEHYTI